MGSPPKATIFGVDSVESRGVANIWFMAFMGDSFSKSFWNDVPFWWRREALLWPMGSAQDFLAAACVQPTWIWHLEMAAIHIYSLQGNCWPKFTRECKWMQMNAWNTKRSKEVEVTGSPRVHCPDNSKVKLRVHSRRLQRSIFHCYICSPEGNPKLLVSMLSISFNTVFEMLVFNGQVWHRPWPGCAVHWHPEWPHTPSQWLDLTGSQPWSTFHWEKKKRNPHCDCVFSSIHRTLQLQWIGWLAFNIF